MPAAPQNCQPCLAELCECQDCLSAMKAELDKLSDRLVEDEETLTRMRAIFNSLRGTHDIICSFHTNRAAS